MKTFVILVANKIISTNSPNMKNVKPMADPKLATAPASQPMSTTDLLIPVLLTIL
ncbi:hypothetical protein N506_1585 [Lactobacillus gasseri DSM 14869]|uniref:Uncharacterized protein n=1 Tax=Lactobacillus gasseri TaxID=1596 RepID=A0AB33ZVH9_LACGS|nr:hypothetical protein N506_1585 [Lactobacillus gasseri DSM 14869]GBA96309.1 hypothetical protein LJCM1025_09580 [Lactobacillus gasseri]